MQQVPAVLMSLGMSWCCIKLEAITNSNHNKKQLLKKNKKIVTDLSYRLDPGKIILKIFNFPLSENQEMPWLKHVTDSYFEIQNFCPQGHHDICAATVSWM